jgi:hypothetical protein
VILSEGGKEVWQVPRILSIRPLEKYRLEVSFSNGNTVILDFKSKLSTIRFQPLKDPSLFQRAVTDGESIRWSELIEISTTEVFLLAQSQKQCDCELL